MTNDDLPRRRVSASPLAPGYPTLAQLRVDRRRLIKLAALSTVGGALGLSLTGCPSDGTGGGGTGTGGGGGTGVTTETTVTTATEQPEYVPWSEPHQPPLAGAPPPQFDEPVAVVIGGGPIAVTFKDGATADLVVAAVVHPRYGAEVINQVAAKAAEHATLVRAAVADVPASTLGDAAALDAFEEKLRQALAPTIQGGQLAEVSAAKARAEETPPPPAQAPAPPPSSAPSSPGAPAPSAPAPSAPAPAPPSVPQGATKLSARQLWTPCRRQGCTTCGPR